MRKLLLALTLIASFANLLNAQTINLPQLQTGIFVYDTLNVYTVNFSGTCLPTDLEFVLTLDQSLIPIASGVNLKLLVSQLTTPAGAVTTDENGTVNLYDSLQYSLSYQAFHFHSTTSGTMKVKFIITGTPTTALQNYPCEIDGNTILIPPCLNLVHFAPGINQCSVINPNTINEINNFLIAEVTSNPASNSFQFSFK
jgi:hypothetical protein